MSPHSDVFLDSGIKLPSVTEIINVINKPWLCYWYGKYGTKFCESKKAEAADRGRKRHELISKYLLGEIDKNERLDISVQTLVDWIEQNKFHPVHVEGVDNKPIVNSEYGYGGTPDVIGYFGRRRSELWLIDWKWSSKIDLQAYALQLAGYAGAYLAQEGKKINNGLIVRYDEEKQQVEVAEFKGLLTTYFPVFISAFELFKFVNKKGEWKKE